MDFGFLASEGPDGRTFSSLRSFSIERRPTRYDLHVSILQELFVVHLLFSLSWNVSPGFGSEKLGWFGVRGGWPPQYTLLAPSVVGSPGALVHPVLRVLGFVHALGFASNTGHTAGTHFIA